MKRFMLLFLLSLLVLFVGAYAYNTTRGIETLSYVCGYIDACLDVFKSKTGGHYDL